MDTKEFTHDRVVAVQAMLHHVQHVMEDRGWVVSELSTGIGTKYEYNNSMKLRRGNHTMSIDVIIKMDDGMIEEAETNEAPVSAS